jgi:type II secretory ATPase GspE/PulE/Tfp pilus assembly ATPase PilB-like protein
VDAAPVAVAIEEMAAAEPTAAGPAAIDLDVLAVADARKVSVLVADILEHAVSRGASRVHLLPYKDDFFLVYRVQGGLEKVASAPVSLQASLIDGFKQYAKLAGVPASRPALGRLRTHIGDRDLVLTTSVVPTIGGQRLVISLAAFKPQPRGLEELGVSEAEARALRAMVERGRGILLVCAPVAGGSSTTYYALLAHAASAGKTVYSVEQSIEHEIPAVAQVMIEPGGPSPAAYIAAGMRQDTDVIAIDGLRTVEDVHLAVEAAGFGKLVIATFPAADIASGVYRMLELGAEPHSLAAALTLAVGQRLVRLNCPNCSVETDGRLAVRIPGAPGDIADRSGSGCPNCAKTGFRGATAIHEVLPFTEPVRAVVGRATSRDDIAQAAIAAGMRPLVVSGLARVKSGEVSAEELNRVLRYAD